VAPVIDKDIYVGQGITIRASFRDPENNERVEANEPRILFKRPVSKEVFTVEVSSNEVNEYFGRTIVNEPGNWWCRIESIEPGAAAREFEFKVKRTEFS
jgi:hypothetical protein